MPPADLHTGSIVINDRNGDKLTFLDSGAPPASDEPYTTIIAVHGMGFTAYTFKPMLSRAHAANIRVVAVNRRPYAGSTPLTPEEASKATVGSDQEKEEYLNARGVELATFIDLFIQKNELPPADIDGKNGGVVLLPWSSGHGVVFSAIANLETLPGATQLRLSAYIRRTILFEPPSTIAGLPIPPSTWSHHIDTSVPEEKRYYVPSISRVPTIYNMTTADIAEILDESVDEMTGMFAMIPQALAIYRKACFDRATRARLPKMTMHLLCGEHAPSYSFAAMWDMEDDNTAHGGDFMTFEIIPGCNHFMQWDEPDLFLKALSNILV
ncbi:Alpha/Beta hydrolase protein [Amylostereum chailletii]|nr:Alpha/Beta hydrolase protein [Amylostereum chailletii]